MEGRMAQKVKHTKGGTMIRSPRNVILSALSKSGILTKSQVQGSFPKRVIYPDLFINCKRQEKLIQAQPKILAYERI